MAILKIKRLNCKYFLRYLVYCVDLVGFLEAKDIIAGEECENVVGFDDGKKLLKVLNI